MSTALVRLNPVEDADLKQIKTASIKTADDWRNFVNLVVRVAVSELRDANKMTEAYNLEKAAAGFIAGGEQLIQQAGSAKGLLTAPTTYLETIAYALDQMGAPTTATVVRHADKRLRRNWPLIIGLSVAGVGLLGAGLWYFLLRKKA